MEKDERLRASGIHYGRRLRRKRRSRKEDRIAKKKKKKEKKDKASKEHMDDDLKEMEDKFEALHHSAEESRASLGARTKLFLAPP